MDSIKEVKSVLPSLFEEFISIEDKKFYVRKIEKNKYLCFAYDEQYIIDGIVKSNITLSQVNNIYFAQIEFESIVASTAQVCMKISDVCLGYSNGILVQVPIQLQVNTNNDIDISSLNLSKDTISVSNSSKYLSVTNSYIISMVFILFSLFVLSKVFTIYSIQNTIPNKIENVKSKYNMPTSSIATKSILKKLNKISAKQEILRDAFKYIFDFKNKYGGTMVSIEYKNQNIIIKYKDISAKTLVKYLEKKYTLSNAVVKDKIVTIGLQL
jgi:hypothetical protein